MCLTKRSPTATPGADEWKRSKLTAADIEGLLAEESLDSGAGKYGGVRLAAEVFKLSHIDCARLPRAA